MGRGGLQTGGQLLGGMTVGRPFLGVPIRTPDPSLLESLLRKGSEQGFSNRGADFLGGEWGSFPKQESP